MKLKLNMKYILAIVLLLFLSAGVNAQARLTIENNSMRSMTVKVMKSFGTTGTLHETVTIGPYDTQVVGFSESGYYFTKTKAVLNGKDPVYRKGQSFEVTNNARSYSVLKLTFSIKESRIPQATGGKQISKTEFDQN
ncbi:hypothetical protein EZJ43_00190 [Pedobacter changchengzhani]|uniref:Uncharacterized protein n=1 Tax=Pedobacter changchengzhani TaxID=2529274 RepID=A0A4R5MP18_9SPHI|nr:hypothetical protein [Pedobacter changchengzhani]TDG37552.1 hypothetical protein EZJ43_00190 [Pedobacter changchengzhani]